MSHNIDFPEQKLVGYTLIDRLGAGGYGEVWRAEAPGGLMKAVKYVFGRQDESRAASEMKALERVREVRHPFLLSLERIEVVDGRLIVVTELANGSLRDRYYACVDEGLPGIPREELLGYLRDTADALDYLTTQHELQHLDIKPENLLLLAGHVKVADFGLVKSVSNQTQSLVGGMTPTYAAPEVFQGLPSTQSDQYSLAILYQELLTGALPFPGSNAAELTLQHLNEEPNLSALDEPDRFAMSRALAKDPANRFDSCSAFVCALTSGELMASGPPAPSASARPIVKRQAPRSDGSATEVFAAEGETQWSQKQTPILIDIPPIPEPRVRYVPAAAFEQQAFEASPALFIGIGGSAARVLRTLRQRFTERFESPEAVPTLPMLLLDTDTKTLSRVTRGADQGLGLTSDETIALPLRRPQEYRAKSSQLLHWLGRRWLYNIPRSLQTEGIRPLGRLALADHARQTFQRIRRALTECVSAESLEAAYEQTGIRFEPNRLRVYLCSSISGGTGSGMLLDVAYAVHSILERLDLSDAKVIGALTHSSGRDSRRGELARVNAYSWISEYQHFNDPSNAYPGDEGCGLPGHPADRSAFDTAYLADLGEGLDSIEFESATEEVADYLYLDAVTPVQSVLDRSRSEDAEADKKSFRSFSVRRLETVPEVTSQAIQRCAIDQVVTGWIGREEACRDEARMTQAEGRASTNHLVHGAAQLVGRLKLEPAGLASLSRSLLETHLGDPAAAIVRRKLAELPESERFEAVEVAQAVESLFTFRLGPDNTPDITTPAGLRGKPLTEIVGPVVTKISSDLQDWILGHFDSPRQRALGARRAAEWFSQHIDSLQRDLNRLATAARQDAERDHGDAAISRLHDAKSIAMLGEKRLRQLIDHASIEAAAIMAGQLSEGVATAVGNIDALSEKLQSLVPDVDEAALDNHFSAKVAEVVAEMNQRIDDEVLSPLGGLGSAAREDARLVRLRESIERLSEQVTSRTLTGMGGHANADTAEFDCAEPRLAECGAVLRRIALKPSSGGEPTSDNANNAWTEMIGSADELLLAVEASGLSPLHVAAELVNKRRDYAELASRVHTRKDIRWTDPLEDVEPSARSAPVVATIEQPACTQPLNT